MRNSHADFDYLDYREEDPGRLFKSQKIPGGSIFGSAGDFCRYIRPHSS